MPSLDKAVNACLNKMHNAKGVDKGVYGEQAAFKICESIYQKYGGLLYHSYSFKVDPAKAGNIKVNEFGKLIIENLGSSTEIDVLLITPYKIFPIEVKAYKAKEIILTDDRISGCYKVDKSPIHQNEMHARHLYSRLFKCLPNGASKYIVPVCVFVDECKILDKRSDWQKSYIYKATLSNLFEVLTSLNTLEEFRLDLSAITKTLTELEVSTEKKLPLIIR